jgi:hypothetical protein
MFGLRQTEACGPFFTDAIFVFEKHPEFPLERFARGQLGVLQTTYARSYLVAAYRNLIGEKLSDAEVKALNELWDARINLSWESNEDQWIKKWNDARAKVPGVAPPPEIRAYRNREKPHDYDAYLNCQEDAFENAEATLSERIKHFGAESAAIRDWAAAQDAVFSNCGGGQHIPDPPSAEQDALIRADRAYQTAAANFYAMQFDEAAKQFDAIAHDGSSPWRALAPYLAARALLRKGSLAEKEEQGKPALAEAETRLKSIVKDKELARSHHAAGRLLNLARLRLHPEETISELARTIVRKDAATDFKQSVWDYTALLDKFLGDDDEVKSSSVPDAIRSDDLTDWIVTFQDQSDVATSHALEQWQKKKTVSWLVAAISKANGQAAQASDLMNAAGRVDRASPALPSLIFHTARLLTETNRSDEARALLDRTLAGDRSNLSRSAVNLLVHERMMLAKNLGEFLRSAQREPAGFSDNSDGREIPMDEKEAAETTRGAKLFFDTDAANVFNKLMPVGILGDVAHNDVLAANLHRDVARAAFMRAALLDRGAAANQAATVLASVDLDLKELLTAYQRATTPEARRFAAAFLALKYPGLRPYVTAGVGRTTALAEVDSYRDNWWCAEPPGMFGGAPSEGEDSEGEPKKQQIVPPEFLGPSQTEAAKERAALSALGTGPNYLCKTVIDWATRNPMDKRAPEALHLAVKSTRYGCTDKDTGRWSKAAFDLLHRKYPNTSWARETPYWFKG